MKRSNLALGVSFAFSLSIAFPLSVQAAAAPKLGAPCIKLVKKKGVKARLSPGTFQDKIIRREDGTKTTILWCQ